MFVDDFVGDPIFKKKKAIQTDEFHIFVYDSVDDRTAPSMIPPIAV